MPFHTVPHQGGVLGLVLAKAPTPELRVLMLTTLVTNIIGNIPEEEWQEMVKCEIKPCGSEGCKCHEMHNQLMEALRPARGLFDKVIDERSGEKGFSE